MGDKTTSRTEHEVFWEEELVGSKGHYKTTISDEENRSESTGSTPESSQSSASDKWESGDHESNGTFCYLTTACVKSMRLPDNCLELMTLRDFRDNVLMTNSAGRNSVKEYYKMAPEIVQAIENQKNAQNVWNSVYKDIKIAVSLVRSGDFNGAFKHYQEMTLNLKKNYLS